MGPAPTPVQLQSLYAASISAAQRFTSYNFKAYFVRRTEERFRPVLDSLNPPADSAKPVQAIEPKSLAEFYDEQTVQLQVMKRAAEVNRLFEGPKLVVEHPRPITSGGGAGMEASAGGGGQPV